jgi:hypothetical protein
MFQQPQTAAVAVWCDQCTAMVNRPILVLPSFQMFPADLLPSSSSLGPVSLCPGCTSALGSIQLRFNNPVPLIKRQRSLTEAMLISLVQQVGSQRRYNADEPKPCSSR